MHRRRHRDSSEHRKHAPGRSRDHQLAVSRHGRHGVDALRAEIAHDCDSRPEVYSPAGFACRIQPDLQSRPIRSAEIHLGQQECSPERGEDEREVCSRRPREHQRQRQYDRQRDVERACEADCRHPIDGEAGTVERTEHDHRFGEVATDSQSPRDTGALAPGLSWYAHRLSLRFASLSRQDGERFEG